MDSANPPSLCSRLTRIAGTFVGLLLLYILSVGPANYLWAFGRIERQRVVKLYMPLEWIVQDSPLEQPVRVYCQWWWNLGFSHNPDPMSLTPPSLEDP